MAREELGLDNYRLLLSLEQSLGTVQRSLDHDEIARALGRRNLADYTPRHPVRGYDKCEAELLELRRILFFRILTLDLSYGSDRIAELCAGVLAAIEKENDPAKPLPVERVDFRKISANDFFERYVRQAQPVVIENVGFKASRLGFDNLMEAYGREEVPLLGSRDFQHRIGPLRDVANEELYLANSDRLLLDHPELLEELCPETFLGHVSSQRIFSQIFVSNSYAGSPTHCGFVPNLFYQIEGRKQWTVADPANAYLLYPMFSPVEGRSALFWMDELDNTRCPLFNYCPRYEFVLEPGDVLYNPQFWYHCVQNLTQRSVAVATRWQRIGAGDPQSFRLAELGLSLSPRRIEHDLLIRHAVYANRDGARQTSWIENIVHGRTYTDPPHVVRAAWRVEPHPTVLGQI